MARTRWTNDYRGTRPPEERARAQAWETRRRELLVDPAHRDPRAMRRYYGLANVARLLGVSRRSLERWEYQGAPPWYELALIGLARAVPKAPPVAQAAPGPSPDPPAPIPPPPADPTP